MKKSNILWLENLPEGWQMKKLGMAITQIETGGTPSSSGHNYFSDNGIRWLSPSDIVENGESDDSKRFLSEDVFIETNQKLLSGPAVLLVSIGATLGKVSYINGNFSTNQQINSIIPNDDVSAKYLYYYLQSRSELIKLYANASTLGIINQQTTKTLPFLHPPLPTQKAIARHLDERTARIDALIEKKQRLLTLLAERRAALITRAVTRGLEEDVELKDSGVEWLEEIPVGWEVKRVKDVSSIRYGLGEPPPKLDEGIPFIRATDIFRGSVDMSRVQTVDPVEVPWHRRPKLEEREILVVRSGAYTGDSAIITSEVVDAGAIAGYDMIITVHDAEPEYVAYNLLAKSVLQNQIYLMRSRAAQPHLNAEELGSVIMAFPSKDIQKTLIQTLDEKSRIYIQVQEQIEHSIIHLQEYRSALITAAVNGELNLPTA